MLVLNTQPYYEFSAGVYSYWNAAHNKIIFELIRKDFTMYTAQKIGAKKFRIEFTASFTSEFNLINSYTFVINGYYVTTNLSVVNYISQYVE
jgi:hypothetical protein